jgi:catechol 2,3-dioxygenase-like lactoylglutathione lyase family enzyme
MKVCALDHLVLTVADLGATASFYTRVLGMERRTFGDGRVALHFGQQKLNLHPRDRPIDANVRHATPGSADLCFLTDSTMEEVVAHLQACGVPIIEGPGRRTGAQGPLESLYVYDPDENLIEIARLQCG